MAYGKSKQEEDVEYNRNFEDEDFEDEDYEDEDQEDAAENVQETE